MTHRHEYSYRYAVHTMRRIKSVSLAVYKREELHVVLLGKLIALCESQGESPLL